MILTDADLIAGVRDPRVRAKLFAHRSSIGSRVAVRLNLNYAVKGVAIQTVHTKPSPTSRALGYDAAVTLSNASFLVDEAARSQIAAGAHKRPMAAVVGLLSEAPHSLLGTALRFNPKTTRLFVREDDGRAVKSAEEVTVFNTRVYARGQIVYWEDNQ
jgi:hypothetical protein